MERSAMITRAKSRKLDAGHADDLHGDLRQHHRGKDLVNNVHMLLVEHRAGLQTLHHEGAKQYGGNRITWNAKRKEWNHRATGAGVVGAFGRVAFKGDHADGVAIWAGCTNGIVADGPGAAGLVQYSNGLAEKFFG